MVRDSISSGTPIALGFIESIESVKPHKPGEKLSYVREVAGFGTPTIVQERLNGTLLIFIEAQGKLKLGELRPTNTPYLVVEGQVIEETTDLSEESRSHVSLLSQILARWVHHHISDTEQRNFFLASLKGPQEIVGAFSSYLVKDYDLQQMLLEMDNLDAKIDALYRLVESRQIIT